MRNTWSNITAIDIGVDNKKGGGHSMLDIKFVTNDMGDWEGLYIDDELILEAHSIEAIDVIKVLQNKFPITYKHFEVSEEQIESWGYAYPQNITPEGII